MEIVSVVNSFDRVGWGEIGGLGICGWGFGRYGRGL